MMKTANQATFANFVDQLIESSTSATPTKKQMDEMLAIAQDVRDIVGEMRTLENEPVRMVHHLSCTGGTLVAKCIASMPQVWLLNEIDSFSLMDTPKGRARFSPTDMIALMRQGDRDIEEVAIRRVFLAELDALRQECWETGRSLVLRDHSHSHFLYDELDPHKPTLADVVADQFPVLSLITVRHPVDSYSSMKRQGWHKQFHPSTFDEYCRRYINFIDRYRDVEIVKYEDFVLEPQAVMRSMCDRLQIEFSGEFDNVYSSFRFSGDSGRSGTRIGTRKRRVDYSEMAHELESSSHFGRLLSMLGYD